MQRRGPWPHAQRPGGRIERASDDGLGSLGGLTVDPRTGKTGKLVSQVGEADEVWYDPGANQYYFAHGSRGAVLERLAW